MKDLECKTSPTNILAVHFCSIDTFSDVLRDPSARLVQKAQVLARLVKLCVCHRYIM